MKPIKENQGLNWGMIILIFLNSSYWACVWKYGFFLPTIWTIIAACVVGLWFRLTGRG